MKYLILVVAICFLACGVLAESRIIEEWESNAPATTEPTPIPTTIAPSPYQTPRQYVIQGDYVYVNDTVDISGVAPPYRWLAYWDGYDMYDSSPTQVVDLDDIRDYYTYWLDPSVYEERLGRWYKWEGKYENRGNNHAFTVLPESKKNYTMTYPNGTVMNMTEILEHATVLQAAIRPEPLLTEKHIADYVVARGDPVELPNESYRFWVFGRIDGIYSSSARNITREQTLKMESGNYKIVLQYPGNNTIYDYGCTGKCAALTPGLYGKPVVDTTGYSPFVFYEKLKELLAGTDDTLKEYTMELGDPYITIHQADEKEYVNTHVLDVRGYTNVANGTRINVSLDEKNVYYKDIAKRFSFTEAIRTSPGNLSYYSVNVPINYDELAADARNHTLTARTALGGMMQKDFKISIMPADSYRPNATLKYIEDRNPFIPTPTPEVITVVQTIVVTKTVTIPVTPSNDVVYEQQRKAQVDILSGWAAQGVMVVIGIIAFLLVALYVRAVMRRL